MQRNKCVVCESQTFTLVLSLKMFPTFMGVTESCVQSDHMQDQNWLECTKCGCIQLANLAPLSQVYQDNHHSEPIGGVWRDHHQEFFQFIRTRTKYDTHFIEIGGAHCYLASKMIDSTPNINYTVVEPNPTNEPVGVRILRGYIEEYMCEISTNEVIIHSHLLEHLYEPREVFIKISKFMRIGSKLFISFPNIPHLIKILGSNSLNFEHTYLLDESVLNYFAALAGLEVVDSYRFRDHSFFYFLEKRHSPGNALDHKIPNLFEYHEPFIMMWKSINNFAKRVNNSISTTNGMNFLFGAHIFSQALIYSGLDSTNITGIIDNSVAKQGKRLYGTPLNVYSPSILEKLDKASVILALSHYQDEVKEQILKINPRITFYEIN